MKLQYTRVESEEQIAGLARLAAEIWREYYISIITMEQIDYMIDRFQSAHAMKDQISRQGYEYYLIQHEGFTVGYMSVKQEGDKLFLSKFYVAREHRGYGYASQAMAFLVQMCQERKLSHMWLTVNRHNEASIAVYAKKGFRIVREQVADIGNGYVMDDYVMELAI